jgi:hypothetical protein
LPFKSQTGAESKIMDATKILAVENVLGAMFPDKRERAEAVKTIGERLEGGKKHPPLLSTKEAVRSAGVTPKTLRLWEKQGRVVCHRLTSRTVRWDLSKLALA